MDPFEKILSHYKQNWSNHIIRMGDIKTPKTTSVVLEHHM